MLSGHESVQPQTSREMFHGGHLSHWLVPTIGGDAWLERPPVPMWFICGVYAVTGTANNDAVARFAAVLAAVPIVLLVAGIGGRLYGRGAGLATGVIYATMHEVYSYSSNPEADIFLALIVTAVLAVFVRLEFPANPDREREGVISTPSLTVGVRRNLPASFLAPLLVAVFFALLGATNLAKGVIFGTAMAAIPAAGYLLWNRSRGQTPARLFWFWGFLIAAAVALAWPIAVIGQHPDILQLWKEHYFGRLNQGYLREPWWYYGAFVPYVILPWTIPRSSDSGRPGQDRLRQPRPRAFLWCWAILPPLVFSLSDGKHHHYLLQCIAPWAVLSMVGDMRDLAIPPPARAQVAARPPHPGRDMRRLRGDGARGLWPQNPRRAAVRAGPRRVRAAGRVHDQPVAGQRQSADRARWGGGGHHYLLRRLGALSGEVPRGVSRRTRPSSGKPRR